jgi:prevent-host-death family protein
MLREGWRAGNACLKWTRPWSSLLSMNVSITDAKAQLTELVRRAEAGEEVVLTRHGQPTVRLLPVHPIVDRETRRAVLEAVRASGRLNATPGPCAARSQDFLYDEDGLPA